MIARPVVFENQRLCIRRKQDCYEFVAKIVVFVAKWRQRSPNGYDLAIYYFRSLCFSSDHSDTADAGYEVSCFCILVIERRGVHRSDNAMMSHPLPNSDVMNVILSSRRNDPIQADGSLDGFSFGNEHLIEKHP